MPAPQQVTLAVYNSAGELVRTLFDGGAQVYPGAMTLSSGLLSPGTPLTVSIPGYFVGAGQVLLASLAWDGTNNNGQPVSGGMYSIILTITDPWGRVSTLQQVVQALPQEPTSVLLVFNSAGEEVQRLLPPASLGGARISSLDLGTGSLLVDGQGANGGSSHPLKLTLHSETGSSATLDWNGLNALGRPVDPGVYTLELVTTVPNGNGTLIVATRSVQVLKGDSNQWGTVEVAPQPWTGGSPLHIRFLPSPGLQVQADLFNVAGELVRQAEVPGDGGELDLEARGLAPGIYLLELKKVQGAGVLSRLQRKVALLE